MDSFGVSEREARAWERFRAETPGARDLLLDYVTQRIEQERTRLEACPAENLVKHQESIRCFREVKKVLEDTKAPKSGERYGS